MGRPVGGLVARSLARSLSLTLTHSATQRRREQAKGQGRSGQGRGREGRGQAYQPDAAAVRTGAPQSHARTHCLSSLLLLLLLLLLFALLLRRSVSRSVSRFSAHPALASSGPSFFLPPSLPSLPFIHLFLQCNTLSKRILPHPILPCCSIAVWHYRTYRCIGRSVITITIQSGRWEMYVRYVRCSPGLLRLVDAPTEGKSTL